MTVSKLEDAIRAVPFRPFSLVMRDGSECPVPRPEHVTHAPNARTMLVSRDAASFSFVDLHQVDELRFQPPPLIGAPSLPK